MSIRSSVLAAAVFVLALTFVSQKTADASSGTPACAKWETKTFKGNKYPGDVVTTEGYEPYSAFVDSGMIMLLARRCAE